MGLFNLSFLDNADHKDLKPGPAVGAANPAIALKRREKEAMGDDSPGPAAKPAPADASTMSQSSFSGYK